MRSSSRSARDVLIKDDTMTTAVKEKNILVEEVGKEAAQEKIMPVEVAKKKAVPVERFSKQEQSDRAKAVDLAVSQIEKQFGRGAIMKLGDSHKIDVKTTPTGSLSLDLALGGGVPVGRIVEIYGPESSGKTTLAFHIAAEVQKAGGTAAFVDAEHAMDPEYAEKVGYNLTDLLVSQPDNG